MKMILTNLLLRISISNGTMKKFLQNNVIIKLLDLRKMFYKKKKKWKMFDIWSHLINTREREKTKTKKKNNIKVKGTQRDEWFSDKWRWIILKNIKQQIEKDEDTRMPLSPPPNQCQYNVNFFEIFFNWYISQ